VQVTVARAHVANEFFSARAESRLHFWRGKRKAEFLSSMLGDFGNYLVSPYSVLNEPSQDAFARLLARGEGLKAKSFEARLKKREESASTLS